MNNQFISREELYNLVWSKPVTTLAIEFGLSYNRLKTICSEMDIPVPDAVYWGKLRQNKPVEKTTLSNDYKGKNEINITLNENEMHIAPSFQAKVKILEQEIIKQEGTNLNIPKKLHNPDHLIIAAMESLAAKNEWSFSENLKWTKNNEISISVKPTNISFALRFMDTFIKIIRKRGHNIIFDDRFSYVNIYNEKIEIGFIDKQKRILDESSTNYVYHKLIPSDILAFYAKPNLDYRYWTDEKYPLEGQLAKIIAYIELKGEELKNETIERKKYWAEQEEKQRIEEEKKAHIEKEHSDFKNLLNESKQWQKARILREYINEVENIATKDNKVTEELCNWLLWARKKADWYDPLVKAKCDLLGYFQ
jgi:hypothetical protein